MKNLKLNKITGSLPRRAASYDLIRYIILGDIMHYKRKIWKTGNVIEVENSRSLFVQPAKHRQPKVNKSSEEIKELNYKYAARKLTRLLNNNFGHSDWSLSITYQEELRPETAERFRKDVENFLKRVRRRFQKQGKQMKYIYAVGYGEECAAHMHLVISGDIDLKEITDCWNYGYIRATRLDSSGDYIQLADYILKHTKKTFNNPELAVFKKRWNQSSNLEIPVPKKKKIKANFWLKTPRIPKGYILIKDSMITSSSEYDGSYYQYYRLLKIYKGDGKRVTMLSEKKRSS